MAEQPRPIRVTMEAVDEGGSPSGRRPDFVALFPTCACGGDQCEECAGHQLAPRTAALLWSCAHLLSEQAYDDVEEFGDEQVTRGDGRWTVFDRYPPITWRQNAVWRRQAARSFDDLADDLAAGDWPSPRCPAEEMALHLVLRTARAAREDQWPIATAGDGLPGHPDDFDWGMLGDVLFQDQDILGLFDGALDGIEDPEADHNRAIGMGDYRPRSWFEPFTGFGPRDGRRPFKR